jgi:exportin-1
MLEQRGNRENILDSHRYLLKISEVNDREIFRICLDYWGPFVADLEEEIRKLPISDVNPMLTLSLKSSLVNGGPALNPSILSAYPLRKHMYAEILTGLRLVMISKMVRPQEVFRRCILIILQVLVVETDEGELIREVMKESDTRALYLSLQECLKALTKLDVIDTELIMTEKLQRQVDGSEWSWSNLNTLCWAVGSIAGTMSKILPKFGANTP